MTPTTESSNDSADKKKRKVTITLDENIVRLIDSEVDKSRFSSRSSGIEEILQMYVPKMDHAIFLLSKNVGLKNMDLIMNELENLLKYNISNIKISYNEDNQNFYKALRERINKIIEIYNPKIEFAYVHNYLGDAYSALAFLQFDTSIKKPIMVVHGNVLRGDINHKIDLDCLYNFHVKNDADMTIVLGDLNFYNPSLNIHDFLPLNKRAKLKSQSHVLLKGNEVKAIQKETEGSEDSEVLKSSLVDIGIYVLNPRVIKFIQAQITKYEQKDINESKKHFFCFTTPQNDPSRYISIIDELINSGFSVQAYIFHDYWNHFQRLGAVGPSIDADDSK